MRNSCSVLVLLALVAVAGYTAGARPVQAQTEAFPLRVGDIVTFGYEDNGSRTCRIEQVHGAFARCGSPTERQGPTIGRREPPEEWINVAMVVSLSKARDQRYRRKSTA